MSRSASLRLPVVSTGAEYLVTGHLMRRSILTYKAPEGVVLMIVSMHRDCGTRDAGGGAQ